MSRFGQVGIALSALGIVIALMGLFPGMTGVEATVGIGVVQVFMLLFGYGLLVFGAIIYAKFTFFLESASTLGQQIGIRLALTFCEAAVHETVAVPGRNQAGDVVVRGADLCHRRESEAQ